MTEHRQVPGENETPVREQDKVMLRLPDGLRDRLKVAAEHNKRSMNAEIVARIQDYESSGLRGESINSHVKRLTKEVEDLQKSTLQKLPRGLTYRIDAAAHRHQRPMSEEIVQALEAAFPAPAIPEMDEVGHEWWWRITEAPPEDRDRLLAEANADLKLRRWPHEFWLEPDDEHGTPTLVLGVRRFGPRKETP